MSEICGLLLLLLSVPITANSADLGFSGEGDIEKQKIIELRVPVRPVDYTTCT